MGTYLDRALSERRKKSASIDHNWEYSVGWSRCCHHVAHTNYHANNVSRVECPSEGENGVCKTQE